MAASYWNQVLADGLAVPQDRSLHDLTAELTRMLGSPDPAVRDRTACPALATWIARGVYDDLLAGLGDGMATGLGVGLGEQDTDTVFRRAASVRMLRECLVRDNLQGLLPGAKILEWGDRIAAWYLRELDVRALVPGKGWAHAVAHGADAVGCLADSPHCGVNELVVLLDVLADRMLLPVPEVFTHGEADRVAAATLQVLRRNLVPLSVLEPWIARVAARARRAADTPADDTYLFAGNAQAFLRALYLQLSLAPAPPAVRTDLLLVIVDALRQTNPDLLLPPGDVLA